MNTPAAKPMQPPKRTPRKMSSAHGSTSYVNSGLSRHCQWPTSPPTVAPSAAVTRQTAMAMSDTKIRSGLRTAHALRRGSHGAHVRLIGRGMTDRLLTADEVVADWDSGVHVGAFHASHAHKIGVQRSEANRVCPGISTRARRGSPARHQAPSIRVSRGVGYPRPDSTAGCASSPAGVSTRRCGSHLAIPANVLRFGFTLCFYAWYFELWRRRAPTAPTSPRAASTPSECNGRWDTHALRSRWTSTSTSSKPPAAANRSVTASPRPSVGSSNLTNSDLSEGPSTRSGLRSPRNGLKKDGSDGTRTRDLRRDRPAF